MAQIATAPGGKRRPSGRQVASGFFGRKSLILKDCLTSECGLAARMRALQKVLGSLVAQLVERRTVNPLVVGSSPTQGATSPRLVLRSQVQITSSELACPDRGLPSARDGTLHRAAASTLLRHRVAPKQPFGCQ